MRNFTLLLTLLVPSFAGAQHGDIFVWSTASGGGALTTDFDAGEPLPVFQNLCAGGQCLFSNSNPGFNARSQDRPEADLFALVAGTAVSLEVVAIDAALSIKFGSTTLTKPGDSFRLGLAPNIHEHPSWQVVGASGATLEPSVTLKLKADSRYADSTPFVLRFTNNPAVAEPTPTATEAAVATATVTATATTTPTPPPTATATASATPTEDAVIEPCTGDCNGDGEVTVDEIVLGIGIALGNAAIETCVRFDANADGQVTVDEVVQAVNRALDGCGS